MKKLLTVLSVIAVAGAVSSASAMDRTGKVGLGFQEGITNNALFGTSTLGSWSVKYGLAPKMMGQFTLGFDSVTKSGDKSIDFGGRFLYDLIQKENSNFYTGLGVGWAQDKKPVDNRVLQINIPLGYEFSFASLPEIGFSAEAGIMLDYAKAGKSWGFHSVGGTVGGALGLGVHYYF